jgi:hypothetical protein
MNDNLAREIILVLMKKYVKKKVII